MFPAMLDDGSFAKADHSTPKYDHWWAFPVCAFDDSFAGNERAVFEEVRKDPSIRKIVLTRRRGIAVDGKNVVVVPLNSPEGQYHLLRAGQIFVKHSPSINAKFPLSPKLHNFINLWHGIPLKRFGYASMDMVDKLDWLREENIKCRAVISSSKMDTLAMAAAFYPLSYREVWATGLPRNDFILRAEAALPADLREQGERLRGQLGGRRLVLFSPTFKNSQEDGYYKFGADELAFLGDWLQRHHAVLGVREHMADKARTYSRMLSPLGILDLSSSRYPDIEILYREAALLVTDYSSCAIDFMLTGKPVVSFAYDYDHYANTERGLFYDLEHVFPGPVCKTFDELANSLEQVFDKDVNPDGEIYMLKRKVFFDHVDDSNSWRVVKKVKALYVNGDPERTAGEVA
jgi:CDP-glycerol glycerophosphotransferase (TagB/SpsB family)